MTLLLASNAFAGDAAHKTCLCRANEQKYSQGQVLCLNGKLARCEMNLNIPTWKTISATCPQANVNVPLSPLTLSTLMPDIADSN
jgi:hypothetical protein